MLVPCPRAGGGPGLSSAIVAIGTLDPRLRGDTPADDDDLIRRASESSPARGYGYDNMRAWRLWTSPSTVLRTVPLPVPGRIWVVPCI